MGEETRLLQAGALWKCLTCGFCNERCHLGVDFLEFVRLARSISLVAGMRPEFSHHDAIFSAIFLMAHPVAKPRPADTVISAGSAQTIIYFPGCLGLFDALFPELGIDFAGIGRNVRGLLAAAGFDVMPLEGGCCCGHDLLFWGSEEKFLSLAGYNLEQIKKSGAKRIVTSCPECLYALKVLYPRHLGAQDFQVLHWTELLTQAPAGGFLLESTHKVTYLDSCRLGRLLGIFEPPREALRCVPGLEFCELPRNRKRAPCCGVGSWTNCDGRAKSTQLSILDAASSLGAELLLTGCPKCLIHLRCARQEEERKGRILPGVEDISSVFQAAASPVS